MRRLALTITSLLLVALTNRAVAQPTWAERLGYPTDKPVVILHADDAGVAYEFNRPCQQALKNGSLQSVSVMAAGSWFPEFAQWRRSQSKYDVGLSLSFVCPSELLTWGPLSPHNEVPSLVNADGHFANSVLQFSLRANPDDVRREIERQISFARASGLAPTHLIPHLGCLLTRADLMQIYLEVAQEYWIPAVMVEFTPEMIAKFRQDGYPLDDNILRLVSAYPLPKIDNVVRVEDADSYDGKRKSFFKTIGDLPPGITQVFLSPADKTPALARMTTRWKNRMWEARLLKDPKVKEFLDNEQITSTNWREIMQRFEATGTSRDNATVSSTGQDN